MLTRYPPAITRSYTLLYTLGLLTMLTRIQLNLLGRRSYLSSVVSLATGSNATPGTISLENNDDDSPEQAYSTDFDVNRKYLTFSWWLLNRGWVDVMQHVEGAVRQVFGHLSPRDTVTLDTFAKLSRDVRTLVEGSAPASGAGTNWLPFLLPPPDKEEFVLRESGVLDSQQQSASSSPPSPTASSSPSSAVSLRRLLDETADLVESPTFSHVLTQLLDAGFSLLHDDKLVAGVFDAPATALDAAVSRAVQLPKILGVVTRQAHAIGKGMPAEGVASNEFLQAMEAVQDLEGFAAVVYSSNWQADIVADEEAGGNAAVASAAAAAAATAAGRKEVSSSREVSGVGESVVMVDTAQSSLFDSVWEKASSGR